MDLLSTMCHCGPRSKYHILFFSDLKLNYKGCSIFLNIEASNWLTTVLVQHPSPSWFHLTPLHWCRLIILQLTYLATTTKFALDENCLRLSGQISRSIIINVVNNCIVNICQVLVIVKLRKEEFVIKVSSSDNILSKGVGKV